MSGAALVRADAIAIPLADESVDLVVTSPPYFALRSYQDGGEHYAGQIGSEPTPEDFLVALWAVTAECWRVLKPGGSIFVNLGDKYAGSGGHNNAGLDGRSNRVEAAHRPPRELEPAASNRASRAKASGDRRDSQRALTRARTTRRQAPDKYNTETSGIRAKSLLGLPWRFAIGCTDPGYRAAVTPARPDPLYPDSLILPSDDRWILRAEVIWSKPNGLPESVQDRVRRSHEQWFHLTKEGRYFAAVDEIREPHQSADRPGERSSYAPGSASGSIGADGEHRAKSDAGLPLNPAGKLPGSVWSVATEPLTIPAELGIDHFAAFPTEWPRRLILGWSPTGICTACQSARQPVVTTEQERYRDAPSSGRPKQQDLTGKPPSGRNVAGYPQTRSRTEITGYSCGCPEPSAPTRPAVVLDPFGGTGTTAMVAKALGRFGVSIDLSNDYLRLARWRVFESGHDLKAIARTLGPAAADREERRRYLESLGAEELSLFEVPS